MDFGMYQGLQRKSNIFETKAANRQMEMQIAATREQRAQADLQKDTEVDVAMQEYFNSINQLDILDQDKERVKAEEMALRMDVVDKVRQYNGNLQNFAFGGGAATMEKYKNNLMESEAVQNAIANKTNYAQWQHAQANGLFVKDVGVDVPVFNPETGQMETQHQKVGMDKAWQLFEQGAIAKMPYDGAEKDIDIGPEFFQKIFKDTNDPYSSDNKVTANDVYLTIRENGGSHDQALTKMNKYQQLIDNGATQWTYRRLDPLDRQIKQEQLRSMRMRRKAASGGSGGSGGQVILDTTKRLETMQKGGREIVLPEEWNYLASPGALGLVFDSDTNSWKAGSKPVIAYDKEGGKDSEKVATYDLSLFDDITPLAFVKNNEGTLMAQISATFDPTQPGTPVNHSQTYGTEFWFGTGANYAKGADKNNWTQKGDRYEGTLFVPVESYFHGVGGDYVNKQLNLRNNMVSYDPQAMITPQQWAVHDAQNIITPTVEEVMRETQTSYNQALAIINQFLPQEENTGGNPYVYGQ